MVTDRFAELFESNITGKLKLVKDPKMLLVISKINGIKRDMYVFNELLSYLQTPCILECVAKAVERHTVYYDSELKPVLEKVHKACSERDEVATYMKNSAKGVTSLVQLDQLVAKFDMDLAAHVTDEAKDQVEEMLTE